MTRSYEEVSTAIEGLGLVCTPEYAAPLMDDSLERLYFGGWRSSKTTHECLEAFLAILDWLAETLQGRNSRRLIWLVGPDYTQTREEYRYLQEWLEKSSFVVEASTANEGPRPMKVTHPWAPGFYVLIETKSSQHPETLASVAPDLILACESGQLSEEVRDMLRGRSGEKAAPIVWGGTVEDDEGHQQWAWYQETARQWLDNPTPWSRAWCLPSWENPLFKDCRSVIVRQPSMARFCPDENHGEAHGYRLHPSIKYWEDRFDGFTFARRIAAIPTGVQYAVYPQTNEKALLQPISQTARLSFMASAGGIDYGTVHPSALVVVQLTDDPRDRQVSFVGPKGVAWVRECTYLLDGGDSTALLRARKDLAQRYRCYRWKVDPNERYMAKSMEGEATSYSQSAREARIGLVTARLNLGKLLFDMDGPGVPELYEEMKRVHRRKTREGELKLVRLGDDRTAALEDAIEELDGLYKTGMPKAVKVRGARGKKRSSEFVPV